MIYLKPLFIIVGIMKENYLEDVKYLKAYGVNSFSGDVYENSIKTKIKWICCILHLINNC